ncbi:hypothetical protein GCM10027169_23140 [Gordonia jinhuaensis]|uniref:HTH luxR-type domain-containing protein n=1 Tax=Gordonia jinhuaensis TaxID=1517702 RepID=A0A916TEF9_9ACTN|nr:helix-turn-helix transcriptional regulator [Gordonia jinhuaensis]GGB40915.1 hypothetical protein GCM10011489_30600 [Gordonia jinhuaensis]
MSDVAVNDAVDENHLVDQHETAQRELASVAPLILAAQRGVVGQMVADAVSDAESAVGIGDVVITGNAMLEDSAIEDPVIEEPVIEDVDVAVEDVVVGDPLEARGEGDQESGEQPADTVIRPHLSARELEVLLAWLDTDSKAEAADKLFITAATVNTHLARIRRKYQLAGRPARTKAQLLARVVQDGHASLDDW